MNNRRPPSIFNAGAARFAPVGQSVTRPKAQRPKGSKTEGSKAPRPKALRLQVPAGSQCLRPHGDARPPHEQGAGTLRFGSDGAAVGADGGRPTSRGLPPAVRWATLPCPGGQGTLQVCVFDAVCPAGKGATERRAGSWRVAGESGVSERFAHQGLSRRAGERGRRAFPRKGDGDTCHPANETHPYPAIPSTSSARGKRGALQGTSSRHRFSRRTSGA